MLRVNIADTPSKHERGLMFVKDLPHDHGMLFKFPQPKKLSFWGLNTYIPLDIAFVNSNNQIIDIQEIHPLNQKAVACKEDCPMAIEANIDYFKDNGITVGDTINLIDDIMEGPVVKFIKVKKTAQKSETEEITVEDAEEIELPVEDFLIDEYEQEPYNEGETDDYEDFEGIQELPQVGEGDIGDGELAEYGIEDIQFADDFDEELEAIDPSELFVDTNDMVPEQPEGEYPQFTNPSDAMRWGDFNNEVVWIDYDTRSGRNIQRNIEPHGTYVASNGNQIVVAFDETANDIRAFIVNKIKDFQFLGRTFKDKFVFSPQ